MGIFSGRAGTKPKAAATDSMAAEIAANRAKLAQNDIDVPPSPEEKPKRSLLARAGSLLGAFETAPAFLAAIRGEQPVPTYGKSIARGLSTTEDIATKPAYSDVLEEVGWKTSPGEGKLSELSTWKNFGREMLGVVGDIALDPTTYLSFGTGAVAKTGTKVLSKTGVEVLKTEIQKTAPKIAETLAEKGIKITETELTQAAEKSALRKLATQTDKALFDQGGIKFAGQTIISGDALKAVTEAVTTTARRTPVVREISRGLQTISDTLGKAFSRDFNLPAEFTTLKQGFLNSYKSATDDVVKDLTTVFKGISPEDRVAITHAIEGKTVQTLKPELQDTAAKAKFIFDDIAKKEQKLGILDNVLQDYVSHIYKNKEKKGEFLAYLTGNITGAPTKFNKARKIPTIAEAKKLGYEPEEDVAKILAARLLASVKAQKAREFLLKVGEKYGAKEGKLPPLLAQKLGDEMIPYASKALEGIVLPRRISEDLAKIGKWAYNDEAINQLLRGYDAGQNFYKGSVTSIFPAFHGRNFISNVAQNMLDIGIKALNPFINAKALNVLRDGSKGVFTTKTGVKYTYGELRKIMKENGVLSSPGYADVWESLEQKLGKKIDRKSLVAEIRKIPTVENAAFRTGRAVGSGIENHARAINFLGNLERGLSPADAAARTNKFLFDYGNLSQFEKQVMKRLIPFYTWTRKNVELQAETLLKTPGKISAQLKLQRLGASEDQEERKHLPGYIAQGLAIKTGKFGPMTEYLAGMGLPIENAFQNLPQGISVADMKNYLNKLGSQSSVMLKFPIELATTHDFFQDRPIKEIMDAKDYANLPQFVKDFVKYKEVPTSYKDKKTGKQVSYVRYVGDPYRLHLLRAMPTSRLTGTAAPLLEMIPGAEKPEQRATLSATERAVRFFTGIKIYPVDIQRMEDQEQKQYLNELQDLMYNYGLIKKFTNFYEPKEPQKDEKKAPLRSKATPSSSK